MLFIYTIILNFTDYMQKHLLTILLSIFIVDYCCLLLKSCLSCRMQPPDTYRGPAGPPSSPPDQTGAFRRWANLKLGQIQFLYDLSQLQWNLRITDTLGTWLLSVVENCPLLGDWSFFLSKHLICIILNAVYMYSKTSKSEHL